MRFPNIMLWEVPKRKSCTSYEKNRRMGSLMVFGEVLEREVSQERLGEFQSEMSYDLWGRIKEVSLV